MKTKILKGSIVVYTLAILSAALVLFLFSDQSENFADTEHTAETSTEKIVLPSGERSQTIECGKTISIQQIFGVTKEEMADLIITTDPIDTNKVGTFTVGVYFRKEDQTSKGLLHLTIKDTQKPTIKAENITVYQGTVFDPFTEVTAQDNVDGEISQKINMVGTVDTSQEGVYTLTYTVSDTSHNETEKIREVTVVPNPTIENESTTTVTTEAATVSEPTKAEPTNQSTGSAGPQSNTLCINGQTIAYQNGGQGSGQAIIDSNTNGSASTWGGVAVQSGNDGANTHFIGHNPGAFSGLLSVSVGQTIVVTEADGSATTYTINQIVHLDDYGVEVGTGINFWDQVVGAGGGERITLQTCLSDSENLIVFAMK